MDNTKFDFEIDTNGVSEDYKKIIEKSLKIKANKNNIDSDNSLEYYVKFNPLKPFKATVEFKVSR